MAAPVSATSCIVSHISLLVPVNRHTASSVHIVCSASVAAGVHVAMTVVKAVGSSKARRSTLMAGSTLSSALDLHENLPSGCLPCKSTA